MVNLRKEIYPVKIPTEDRINMVISSSTQHFSVMFHLSKYGLRPDEISKIILRDLDLERGELSVRTSKLGLERTLKLKPQTRDLLKEYVSTKGGLRNDEKLFPEPKTIQNRWRFYRQRAYSKFKDLELLKIRLYDLRHWFGTMAYVNSRDIFHVKYLMGHRNIQSTLHYMHIAKGMINYSDDYTVKVAASIEEFTNLLESGFEYVSDYEGKKVLRKRK
jgi:integrase